MCDLAGAPIRSATGRFLPGRSGNPAGRPRGSRNRGSLLIDVIDEADSAAIVRAVVDRALAGEWPALRACFTRLVAPAREAPVEIDLPPAASALDVAEAGSALIAAVAAGEIAPGAAQKVMKLLASQLKILASANRTGGEAAATVRDTAWATTAEACISPVPAGAARPSTDGPGADIPATTRGEAREPRSEAPGEFAPVQGSGPCISPVPRRAPIVPRARRRVRTGHFPRPLAGSSRAFAAHSRDERARGASATGPPLLCAPLTLPVPLPK